MRVAQRRDGACLLLKPLGVTAREYLDGDGPAQARVDRLVDLTHASCTESRHDFIRSETRARGESSTVTSGG
jgi:hypothetical protein